ncbi:MAG: tellurite resistance/C4-dicarboxylate transporter family protein [Armatimonadota bacterium]
MSGNLQNKIKTLFPGYFAIVMATGIVAIASKRVGIHVLDIVLLTIAVLAFVVLIGMTVVRVISFRSELLADFRNAAKAPGYFTMVAGSGVLGTGLLRIAGQPQLAWGLWIFAILLYTFLIHAFLFSFMTVKKEGTLVGSLNGGWLLLVVGLQSIASLGAMLTETTSNHGLLMALSVSAFLLASGMYLLLIISLTMRLILLPLEPEQLVPTYWIMMGAAAISTLAGAELSGHATMWTLGINVVPFLHGLTFIFWVVATSWIPLLIMLGFWRHVTRKVPIRYEPMMWSIVFPLGMYTSATHAMIKAFSIHDLQQLPLILFPFAFVAWLLVGAGMVGGGLRQSKGA